MNLFPSRLARAAPAFASPDRAQGPAWSALGVAAFALGLSAWWLLRTRARVGADGWFLKPHPAWPAGAWWLPLSGLLLFGGLSAACAYDRFYRAKSRREQQTSLRLALGSLMLLSLVWNWGVLGPLGFNARGEARTGFFMLLASSWSDVATEYLGTAYRIENAREFSSRYALDWQQPRSVAIAHVATHPPGATLFYFACRRLVEEVPTLREGLLSLAERGSGLDRAALAAELNQVRSSAAASGGGVNTALPPEAVATALLASLLLGAAPALAVPALFALGSLSSAAAAEPSIRRAQGRGVLAAALWILAPSTGLFAPTLDALVALGAAWTLALCGQYLQRAEPPSQQAEPSKPGRFSKYLGSRIVWLIGAGAVLSLAGFVSFGALTAGLVAALWLLLERRPRAVAWLLGGALGMQMLLLIVLPHAWPQVFAQAMHAHKIATLNHRPFKLWPALNLLVFALFAGWPVVIGSRGLLLKPRAGDGLEQLKRLGLATLSAMLLISLAGGVRGEVERLWMFLLPPFCALAAAAWLPLPAAQAGQEAQAEQAAQAAPRRSKVALVGVAALLVVALQAAQSLLMAATLAPLVLPL